jgi:hypothetical protein
MAGIPKVKITFDADLDELKKGTKQAEAEVEGFSDKVAKFGKAAAAAFAVAGIAATKFAIDAVKNAAADDAAQRKLIETIKASTNATAEQTAAVADYIDKTSIAIGVTDDELRPSLSRLIRSTNDVEKAQELLNLALDISAATGKPLADVSNALGKAYDGNSASLGRLGLGLDAAVLKAGNFDTIQKELTQTFGNFAENEAASAEKIWVRLGILFDEAKETLGTKLLPVFVKVGQFLLDNFNPALELIAKLFKPITDAVMRNKETFTEFGDIIKTYVAPVLTTVLGGALSLVAKIAGGVIDIVAKVIGAINSLINGAIDGINAIIRVYNKVNLGLPDIGLISAPQLSMPTVSGASVSASLPTVSSDSGASVSAAKSSATAAVSTAANPTGILYKYGATATTEEALRSGILPTPGVVNNITVNGAIDAESTARQIVDVLNQSTYRGTLGSSRFVAMQ